MAVNETVGINVVADTRTLRTQLREATQDFLRLQQSGSATATEINNAAKRAADLKERISDAKDTIAAFNPEAKFKAFGQVIQGVAGAFAATQGALALVGVEGEAVEKTLLKVQGALALSEGLNTVLGLEDAFSNLSNRVKESSVFISANSTVTAVAGKIFKIFGLEVQATSTAFRVLKGAIAATGIGLLVIALGEAVAAFQSFSNGAEEAKKAQDELNKSVIAGAKAQREGEKDSLRRQEELEIARAKRSGATEAEIFAIQDKYRKLNIRSTERYFAEIKGKGKEADEADKELKDLNATRTTSLINFQTDQAIKAREKGQKLSKENQDRVNAANKKAKEDFEKLTEETARAKEKAAKEDEDLLNRNLSLQDKEILETQEKYDKLVEERKKYGLETVVIETARQEELAKVRKKYADAEAQAANEKASKDFVNLQTETEGLIAESNRQIQTLADSDLEKANNQALSFEERYSAIADREKLVSEMIFKSESDKTAFEKLNSDARKKIAVEEGKAKIAAAAATADTLANLANLLGQETAAGKAAAVASATISAILSAQKAYESTIGIPYVGPILAPINAGIALASGYKSIQSILAVKVPGGGGEGGSPSLPGAPSAGAGAPIAPRSPEAIPTSLDQRSLNQISNVVGRAYVVESDITGSQQRISRLEKAARF
jgi:hypothetical protein